MILEALASHEKGKVPAPHLTSGMCSGCKACGSLCKNSWRKYSKNKSAVINLFWKPFVRW